MAPKTSDLKKITNFLKDLSSQIKADEVEDDAEITVQHMMSLLEDGHDENVEEEEEEEYQPAKTRKQRGKLIKGAIKRLPKLKALAVQRIENNNQSTAISTTGSKKKKKGNGDLEKKKKGNGDLEKKKKKGEGDKLQMRYYLPCSPLGCNVCGKFKHTFEDAKDHKEVNHDTYAFSCDFASCGSIYETQQEKNKHMKKH